MRRRHGWGPILIIAALAVHLPSAAAARCGDAPGDAAALSATRAAIALQCDCAGAASHGAYVRCAKGVIAAAVGNGDLPSTCASAVKRCVSKSTCGRPGAVTCCRTTSSGTTSCGVKTSPDKCRAPSGGHACVGVFSSCCEACGGSGCAPAYTPTITPTPTSTPTPTITATFTATPTLPAVCQGLIGLPALAQVPFTVLPGTVECGGASLMNPPPQPPLSGQVLDGSNAKLGDLGLGCLNTGFLPGLTLPDGATAKLDVVGVNLLPPSVTLAGSAGSGANDCTKGAGPGAACANGAPGTDGTGTCASDADCGDKQGACLPRPNCFFGPPIPLSSGGLAACVLGAFLTDLCGKVDLLPPQATLATALSARVYFTANQESPCPRCIGGVCDSGTRMGMSCTPVGSLETSVDCPPPLNTFVTALTVTLPALTTGQSVLQAGDGFFCNGQQAPGAFGLTAARTISEQGVAPGGSSNLLEMTLAGTFCVPATDTFLDTIAQLPGPGSITAKGQLDLGGILP